MTNVFDRQIGTIRTRLHKLLPKSEPPIAIDTPPDQVRERIITAQDQCRSRIGYQSPATESEFVAERAHADIDRRLATRSGRRSGLTDRQLTLVATGVLERTAGRVERSTAAETAAAALVVVAGAAYMVLLAFGLVGGLWDLERMPGADIDALDRLSRGAALMAVLVAVCCAAVGVVLDMLEIHRRGLDVRRYGAATLLYKVSRIVIVVFGSAFFLLALYFLGVASAFTLI